jgi:hypothetical protein
MIEEIERRFLDQRNAEAQDGTKKYTDEMQDSDQALHAALINFRSMKA